MFMCLMHKFEAKILQCVDPPSHFIMNIWNSCQPRKWFVINSKCKMITVHILHEVHYPLDWRITLTLHGVELLLNMKQTFVRICNDLFIPPFLLR
jgi:hypothetical protein